MSLSILQRDHTLRGRAAAARTVRAVGICVTYSALVFCVSAYLALSVVC